MKLKQQLLGGILLLLLCGCDVTHQKTTDTVKIKQPNILWIFVEDLSPYLGCYGDSINKNHTPALDQLAEEGVLFERVYATAPVCSASRSAMITGKMQTTTGTHQHRSSRTTDGEVVPEALRIYLPDYIQKTVPELMSEAGYFTFNSGKDDYNFHYDRRALYTVGTEENYQAGMNGWQGNKSRHYMSLTEDTWNAREDKDQPWFGQIELKGGKTRGTDHIRSGEVLGVNDVPLPPYFPDVESHKKAWVQHYNAIRSTDAEVEEILEQLDDDDELENTIIFFFSDHGSNTSLRHKQFCYEGGVHVPLIIKGNHPDLKAKLRRNDLVSTLDISATTLAIGGVEIPDYFDGQNLLDSAQKARKYVVSARDRCDFTIDRIRTLRTDQYRYIRNYFPERSMMQASYRDRQPMVKDMHRLHENGKLTDYQEEHWFGARPKEELYDIEADPHQMNNLALDKDYNDILLKHRTKLNKWIRKTKDQGETPEDTLQLKATYELWKDRAVFKNAEVNPEYNQFMN
ncbi:sulfatase [Flammeovirga sp. SJP92]|uniref:sulfatase family protein n=1 Tax=Flammeovirga sp. SJP92 TaxID=1775430 RepID=UPI00078909BF|nr:sulfatase [Flammeovirga sp. SJP92]KXX66816.1 phosphate ABC transporter substrate-binding protein [Flammeovirga sp. SJP92]